MCNTIAGLRTLALLTMLFAAASTTYTVIDVEDVPDPSRELWLDAEACLVWPELLPAPECFPTEQEMDSRIAQLRDSAPAARLACSGTLRLYDGTSYGTPVLALSPGALWTNLSTYGFDNRTSSYRIGPCDAQFAADPWGGGAFYPQSATAAYMSSPSMISGWNNRVSSVRYP